MERIQFQPYSRDQLKDIVTSRLEASREGLDTTENVMHPDAVLLAASRIAAVTGDARRVLDISRYVHPFSLAIQAQPHEFVFP